MTLKSRLLTTALVIPALVSVVPALAFDITTAETAGVSSSVDDAVDENGDFSISGEGSITLSGTQSQSAGVTLDHSTDTDTIIDGAVVVLDYDADTDTRYDTSEAYGVFINAINGITGDVTLGREGSIFLVDSLAPADNDEDGIPDGVTGDQDTADEADDVYHAGEFAQDYGRFGIAVVDGDLTGNLRAEAGSQIYVTAYEGGAIGLFGSVTGHVDLLGTVAVRGSDAAAFYLDSSAMISETLRIGGSMQVVGEGSIGVLIEGELSKSLQIEGLVSATGFQSTAVSNAGLLAADDETNLDANELKDGGSALLISGDVDEGLLINGIINYLRTADEKASLETIASTRADGDPVTDLKTQPYHFDENRVTGNLSVRGSAPALDIDGATIGSVVESFRDTVNDDGDDETAYLATTFAYSHSLMNRGTISAEGYNDGFSATGIRTGASNVVSTSLTGGLLNAGSISATAYNNHATAVDFVNNDGDTTVDLGNGGRERGDVFLNEGSITANITTNDKTAPTVDASSYAATGVKLGAGVDLPSDAMFINRGTVQISSTHISDDEVSVGDNAVAFDFSAHSGDITLVQELRSNDQLDGTLNKYLGNGDEDLDTAGATDADGAVIGDGPVTTQDTSAPQIVGDVRFGAGDNTMVVTSGTVTGNVHFGAGDDQFVLLNTEFEPLGDSTYEQPDTVFRGALTNSGGQLIVYIEDKASLTFIEQENVSVGLALETLAMQGTANIGFEMDDDSLAQGTTLVNAEELVLTGSDFTITPSLSYIDASGVTVRFIETASDLSSYSATINDHLSGQSPYLFDVSLAIAENVNGGANDAIDVSFDIKSASQLGLNQSQSASLAAVLDNFAADATLATAMTSLVSEETFIAAYDQLLPHYGDGTARQLAALAGSASGAVSQQMQMVKAGGRNGGDGWVQQFGHYTKQDATTESDTLNGDSFSLAAGYDMPLLGLDAVGVFMQMNFTNIDEKNGALVNEVKSDGVSIGAYVAQSLGPIGVELTGQVGATEMESLRTVEVATLGDTLRATWDAETVGASAKVIVPILTGKHQLQLEGGVDYFFLDQDGYTENSIASYGFAMQVGDAESEITTSYIGLRGRSVFAGRSTYDISWAPSYYVGMETVNTYEPYQASANFVGRSETFTLQTAEEMEDKAAIGFGISAYNDFFAIDFEYRGAFGDGVETHGGGLAVRLKF